jgi:protein-S-isoprenylcysteine O-methyltransferase Ste14
MLSELLYVVRHLLSIALLPGTVLVVVPIWIARRYGVTIAKPADVLEIASIALAAVLLAIGLGLFSSSLHRFAVEGRGTLAPWDPPRRLVVRGPYRYVRNPMISGVIFLLGAEAAFLRSMPHWLWMLAFAAINVIYIPAFEEPFLIARFGADYQEYCRNVRRFIPRLLPWRHTF